MRKLYAFFVAMFTMLMWCATASAIWVTGEQIPWNQVKVGDTFVMSAASTPKAYGQYLAGNTMTATLGSNCLWVVEEGRPNPVDGEATFLLKQVDTEKYLRGFAGDRTLELTDNKSEATSFGIYSANDSSQVLLGSGYAAGWGEQSAAFCSKTKSGTKSVYCYIVNEYDQLKSGYYYAHDVIAWDLYTAFDDVSVATQLRLLLEQYDATPVTFGQNPGDVPAEKEAAWTALVEKARAAAENREDDATCQPLLDDLKAMMESFESIRIELTDGYYYIVSAYDKFMEVQGVEKALYGPGCNWATLNVDELAFTYEIKKLENGNYSIRNCASNEYISTSAVRKTVGVTARHQVDQIITAWTRGRYLISNAGNAEGIHYVPNSNQFGKTNKADLFCMEDENQYGSVYNENDQIYGWHSWYLRRVTDEVMLAVIQENLKKETTMALESLLDSAMVIYNKCFVFTTNMDSPLIYEADDNDPAHNQISSNAKMPDHQGTNWGRYAYLIDGDPNTFFFTIHNTAAATPPAGFHNIQFDLRRDDVDGFAFYHAANPSWHRYHWEMSVIQVFATNDPDGEWTFIKRLELPDADSYVSEMIQMGACYRYVRFDVEDTFYNLKTGGGECFCIGEIQLYPVEIDYDKSPAFNVDGLDVASEKLVDAIAAVKERIASNDADEAFVEEFKAIIEEVKAAYRGTGLLPLLTELENNPYVFGNDPGNVPAEMEADFNALVQRGQEAMEDGASEEECIAIVTALNQMRTAMEAARLPLTDGYYYIVSAYKKFMDVQGVEKAMYGPGLNWNTLDADDLAFTYEVKKLENGNYSIRNCQTNEYVSTSALQQPLETTKHHEVDQLIEMISGGRFVISNTGIDADVHYVPNANAFGEGVKSNVFCMKDENQYGSVADPEAKIYGWQSWYLRRVTDEVMLAVIQENLKTPATEKLEIALDSALRVYNRCFVYTADENDKLLLECDDEDDEHNQCSSNAKMPDYQGTEWGRYAYLIDGDPNTFFFTIHNTAAATPPAGLHYLQIDLRRDDVKAFSFYHAANPTWHAYKFEWRTVLVYATNDPDGEWTLVDRLVDLPDQDDYTTEIINMGHAYRYVRFAAEDTYRNLAAGGGECFCIGELQLYAAKPDQELSPAFNIEGLADECDALDALIQQAENLIATNAATDDFVAALMEQVQKTYDTFRGQDRTDDILPLMAEAKTLYDGLFKYDESALILNADESDPDCQASSNAGMPENVSVFGYLKNIIDGNPDSFFITKHTSKGVGELPEGLHNIQFDLRKEVDKFTFMYQRCPKWTGFTWRNIKILVTNDPEGEWTQVATFNDMPNVAEQTTYGPIELDGKYRYVRFDVAQVHNTNGAVGGGQAFCIGEMQVYELLVNEESTYCRTEDIKNAADALKACMDDKSKTIKAKEEILQSDVDELQNCIDELKKALADGVKPAAIASKAGKVNVYTIDGRLVRRQVDVKEAANGLSRGLYIIGGKKVAVK